MTQSAQTPLVLVHGWAGSARTWDPVIALLDLDIWGPITAIELPGSPHGDPRRPATIPGAAELVVTTVRSSPKPAIVVGHSMGGQLSMIANAAAHGSVLGEVAIEGAYGADATEREALASWADDIDARGHAALSGFFDDASAVEDVRRIVLEDFAATDAAVLSSYLRSEYIDADQIGLLPQSRAAAAARGRPVLALHAGLSGRARELALPAPSGSLVEVWRGHGHFLHLEDPARFVARITHWRTQLSA